MSQPMIDDVLARGWDQLVGRLSGPLSLRFLLQPIVATTLAVRAGLRDARDRRPPFLWLVRHDAVGRRALLVAAWRDIAKLFTIAAVLDTLYQVMVLQF